MEFTVIENNGNVVKLKSPQEITIYTVEKVYSELLNLFDEFNEIEMDLSEIEELDTCGFQVLYAIKVFSYREGKFIHFINHSDNVLKFIDLFGVAGFFKDRIAVSKRKRDLFDFSYGLETRG